MSRFDTKEKLTVVLLILFSALFRYLIFGWRSFPSGDDEAMSSGFIHLILSSGHIPSINIHHMPGTPYTYPPNFHLTCASLILFTSLPILTITLVIGVLTNILTVPPFYCLSKQILKKKSTALMATFLFAASTSDMYMLTWGGYVNLMALFFVPMIFWISLREERLGLSGRIAGGFLVGALLLTHHFTAFVFVVIVAVCLLLSGINYVREGEARWRSFFSDLGWMMLVGGCLAFGWWLSKISLYATILSGPAERAEVAVTWIAIVSSSIRALTGIAAAMFFISWFAFLGIYRLKKSADGRDPKESVVFLWTFVPVLLSMPYLVGPSPAFQRFLYYTIQPSIMLMSLGLMTTLSAIRGIQLKEVKAAGLFFIGFLVVSYILGTIAFANGNYEFFLSMSENRDHTIKWLNSCVEEEDLLVTEHSFGWWIAGMGHRPTLSASPAPYLSYPYEEPLARAASLILSANYGIENGFIRIDETGPHGWRDNPKIAFIRQGLYHQMLTINDNEIVILVAEGSKAEAISLEKPTSRQAIWMTDDADKAVLRLILEDKRFEVTRTISLSGDSNLATLDYKITAKPGFRILGMSMLLRFSGLNMTFREGNQVGGLNLLQQMGILAEFEGRPNRLSFVSRENAEAIFASPGSSHLSIKLLMGAQSIEGLSEREAERTTKAITFANQEESPTTAIQTDTSWETIKEREVKYVVADSTQSVKFQTNNKFTLTYCNGEVYVFYATY
ncbi:MAG: hypothetical protein JSW01_01155 [Candidatus Bathyarchaeota archaeon]|nr:MAG: hypothetical protein JSW01_01155 [Candidatus Bathyarchaeota archaeon]